MRVKKKIELLVRYENLSQIRKKHLKKIVKLSRDKSALVRSQVATLLVNFKNDCSESILLKLSFDEDALVRTEAYDTLAVFEDEEVLRRLENAIREEKIKWHVLMQFYHGQIL